jgi:hypothetical protein
MEEIFFHVCHFPVKKMVSGHDYPILSSGLCPPLLFFLILKGWEGKFEGLKRG